MKRAALFLALLLSLSTAWADETGGWLHIANSGENPLYIESNSIKTNNGWGQVVAAQQYPDEVVMMTLLRNCGSGESYFYNAATFNLDGSIKSKNEGMTQVPVSVLDSATSKAYNVICPSPGIAPAGPAAGQIAALGFVKGLGKAVLWLGKEYVNYNQTQAIYDREAALQQQRNMGAFLGSGGGGGRCQTIYRLGGKDPIYNCY